MKTKKITLVNHWSDYNKGDSAITLGTISLLKDLFKNEEFEIQIMPMITEIDPKINMRFILSEHHDIKVISNPFRSNFVKPINKYIRVIKNISNFIVDYSKLIIYRNESIKNIQDSDLIIFIGGHYFCSYNNNMLLDIMGLYKRIYPIFIANKFNIPVVLLCHSFGPFNHKKSELLFQYVCNLSDLIFPRENISFNYLKSLNINTEKVFQIPDLAFYLKPKKNFDFITSKYNLNPNDYCVITVRTFKGKSNSKFLDEVIKIIQIILDRGLVSKVLLVAHTLGPSVDENDRIPTKIVYESFKDNESVDFIDDDLSPHELISLYGNAKFIIGTRFHSVILSLVGGTPAFAVSYYGPKSFGIMESLNMSEFVVDMDNFDAYSVFERIKKMLTSISREEIKAKINKLREDIYNKGKNILKLI
jgi:polysaccharide pyruvyl transferase WcaK-like protein